MLYVFGGNKTKARARMRVALNSLTKRAPLANVLRITDEDIEGVSIEELLSSQGLFYNKRIVIFDNALKDKTAQKKVTSHLKSMAKSDHVFFVLEEEMSVDLKKQLTAHATKTEIVEEKEVKQKTGADFSAANALDRKDAKGLWLAVVRGQLGGTAPELVHGQLFWKAKQMILAGRYGKYSERELKDVLGNLAELPHIARRRGVEMEFALERFALDI